LVSQGRVPTSLKEEMKVNYMGGSFDFPIKYGYSLVGSTIDGRNVHLMHPHQDLLYAREVDLYTLPSDLPIKRAALLSNMETCVNALWDAQLTGYEKVLVIGFGGLGALLAMSLKYYANIDPAIKEIDQNKINQAKGLEFRMDENDDYDVIFHTSATGQGLQYAIEHIKKEGSIIEMSWYGTTQVNIDLGGKFHYNRAKLISSQVSTVSPNAPIKNYRDRKDVACQVLRHREFDALIENTISFEDTPLFYQDVRNGKNVFASIIEY
jgi:threonine dehydrogenase-like Zn-dependent dehydrogenase